MRLACLLLVLSACHRQPDETANPDDSAIDPRFAPVVEAFSSELAAAGVPGVAVAVIEGGEVTYSAGFGTADPGNDAPVTPDTLFRVGSVTKMLTATAVLQLADEGAVDLGGSMAAHIPGLVFANDPTWADTITIDQLLSHRSGLWDYVEIDASHDDADLAVMLTGEFAEVEWVMYPPGRMWDYSNFNYYYAGLVAELASGTPYVQRMEEAVFAPLGMDRTTFRTEDVLADGDYAIGATIDWTGATTDPVEVLPDSYDNAWGRPAGYAWSSVLDLSRFVAFLLHGDTAVLSDGARETMTSPLVDTEEYLDLSHYGYGLEVDRGFAGASGGWYDVSLVCHGGSIPGYAAGVYVLPEHDFGMVVLANTDSAFFRGAVAAAMEALVDLPDPTEAPDPQIDPETFGRYVGRYQDPWYVGTMDISVEGEDLMISMPMLDWGGYDYEPLLEPLSKDNFALTITGTEILVTFIDDAHGDAEYLRTIPFVGKKSAETTRGVQPDPARLIEWLESGEPARFPGPDRGRP